MLKSAKEGPIQVAVAQAAPDLIAVSKAFPLRARASWQQTEALRLAPEALPKSVEVDVVAQGAADSFSLCFPAVC